MILDLLHAIGWDKAPWPSLRARLYKQVWMRS
jgi:hypothetical protein